MLCLCAVITCHLDRLHFHGDLYHLPLLPPKPQTQTHSASDSSSLVSGCLHMISGLSCSRHLGWVPGAQSTQSPGKNVAIVHFYKPGQLCMSTICYINMLNISLVSCFQKHTMTYEQQNYLVRVRKNIMDYGKILT